MRDFDIDFAIRHAPAFNALARKFGLDYFVIDCAEMPDGRLLLFEAQVAMIVHAMDTTGIFSYKQPTMQKLFTAFPIGARTAVQQSFMNAAGKSEPCLEHARTAFWQKRWLRAVRPASLGLLLAEGGDARIRLGSRGAIAKARPQRLSVTKSRSHRRQPTQSLRPASQRRDTRSTGWLTPNSTSGLRIGQRFDDIRASITHFLGIPGSEAVLAPSGTDAEVLALAMAAGLATGPLTNILIAPEETGSGVPLAARGCHFSDSTGSWRVSNRWQRN